MKTIGDVITQVLVRNNRTTTDGFLTDTILATWFTDSHAWAMSQKKWPFTEGRISTTYAAIEEINFEGYKADSIRFLKVGIDLFQKVDFESYLRMKNETPNSDSKVYTDFGKTLFINTLSGVSGTLTAYGQYQPYLDVTDLTANTSFANWNDEGNEAIYEKMTGFLKRREHLPDEAELHDQRALAKIEEVSIQIGKEKFAYQNRSGDGMFKRFDVINGGFEDGLTRDQF